MDAEILKNLANWLMLEKCKEVGIDPSGSYTIKDRLPMRGERRYLLVKDSTGRPFMQVSFMRERGPVFIY